MSGSGRELGPPRPAPGSEWVTVAAVVLVVAPAGLVAWVVSAGAMRWGAKRWHLAAGGLAVGACAALLLGPRIGAVLAEAGADVSGAVGAPAMPPGGLVAPLAGWFLRWSVLSAPVGVAAGMLAASITPRPAVPPPEWEAKRARQNERAEERRRRVAGRRADREGGRDESPALAVHLDGPPIWTPRQGGLVVPPDGQLGLAWLMVGAPGAGKSTAAARIGYLCGLERRHLVVVDAKGGHDGLADAMVDAYLAAHPGAVVRRFPDEHLDIWRGAPQEIVNRLVEVFEWTPAGDIYRGVATNALRLALGQPGAPCRSGRELVARLDERALLQAWDGHREEQDLVRVAKDDKRLTLAGARLRIGNLVAALAGKLDGSVSWEDADLWVVTVPAMVAASDADALLRVVLADYAHYTMARKDAGRPAHLLVDEFSAIEGGRRVAIHLLERGRGAAAGVTLSAQSEPALGSTDERARLFGSASAVLAFRTPLTAGLAGLAGTEQVGEGAWQADELGALTGRSTVTGRTRARVDQDLLRQLRTGEAYLIVEGRACRVRVVRTEAGRLSGQTDWARGQVSGVSRPRPLGAAAGNPAPSGGPAGLVDGRGVPPAGPTRPGQAATPSPPASLDPPTRPAVRRQRPAPPGQGDPPDDQTALEGATGGGDAPGE